jgi:hypothetical protein
MVVAAVAGHAGASPRQDDASPTLRRVLVTAGLQQRTVNVISFSEQELVARDAVSGASVRVPLSNVRAVLPVIVPLGPGGAGARRGDLVSGRARSGDDTAVLVTTDGQTLPGRPDLGTRVTEADALPWVSQSLGSFTVPLDSVQRVLSRESTPVRASGTADRVYLRNADVLDGFVELVPDTSTSAVTLSVDTGTGTPGKVEWSGVDSVEFAASPVAARGPWAWLSDGTALAASAVALNAQGNLTLAWSHGTVDGPVAGASLWAFVPAREHIDALAARPLVGVTPGVGRRHAQPPRVAGAVPLSAGDIEMVGPVTATWDLGAGALRVSGVVEMAPSDRVWGDCTVTVESGAIEDASSDHEGAPWRELWTTRINADTPTAGFAFDLPAQVQSTPRLLRVRIGEGENGPVQDRVWLRRVLIER